ncbi:putative quinol monooxygenase [Rhodoferax sp. WC2427]|uniref:putative quinol monooxygenase n=1 Tax=Rhodoferax sp. WC2427 TaxID=3234144 RepID=UPI003467BA0A
MSDLIIIARAQAKPGFEAALVAAQTALVALSRQQPGCIAYELHEDLEQPGKVLFYERWTDRNAWENHIAGAHSVAFRDQAGGWVAESELLQMRQVA